MKKRIIKSIVSLILVFGIFSVYAISSYNIRLGNEVVTLQQPPLMQNDRIFVPIRSFCESLGIPVHWDEEKNEVHVDIYNKMVSVSDKTEYKEQGVIPDEETAYKVGKIILERYADRSLEYETENVAYSLKTMFIEDENAWRVYQDVVYKAGHLLTRGPIDVIEIKLCKNTGEVLFISTYGTFSNIE